MKVPIVDVLDALNEDVYRDMLTTMLNQGTERQIAFFWTLFPSGKIPSEKLRIALALVDRTLSKSAEPWS